MRNIRGKNRVRYEDVDSDYLLDYSCSSLSFPIPRFRIFSGARQLITKLITSSSIQAFPRRLTLSKSSPIKPFLDLSGRRHRKQGFDPHLLQVL